MTYNDDILEKAHRVNASALLTDHATQAVIAATRDFIAWLNNGSRETEAELVEIVDRMEGALAGLDAGATS